MTDKELAVVWMLYFVSAAMTLFIGQGLHLAGFLAAVVIVAVLVPIPGLLAHFWPGRFAAWLELLAAYYAAAMFALATVTIAMIAAIGILRRIV